MGRRAAAQPGRPAGRLNGCGRSGTPQRRRGHCAKQPEQVLRVGRVRHQRNALTGARGQRQRQRQTIHMVQRREILQRETDRVEHRHLGRAAPARVVAGGKLPRHGDREVGRHLLHIAVDAALRCGA